MSVPIPAPITDEREKREMEAILKRHERYAAKDYVERTYSFIRVLERVKGHLESKVSEPRKR